MTIEHPEPINTDARLVIAELRLGKMDGFTEVDCEKWRWKGLIERCWRCGSRAYLHGWCFGCGKQHA